MDFVTIGNPGNAADIRYYAFGKGSVAYTYNLGKYEVSRDMVLKANSAGSLGIAMADMRSYGGNGVNKPATGVSWYEAAKFVNWLNTSTGGTAAYKFDVFGNFQLWSEGDAGYNANNKFRNSLAKYVIASTDEWYKGAYGKADGSWSNYPNGLDTQPTAVAAGTVANTAVYNAQIGPADITNAGSFSAYGTMAQGGNAWEWYETAYDGINNIAGEVRELGGGSVGDDNNGLAAWNRYGTIPSEDVGYFAGFRVASVPATSYWLLTTSINNPLMGTVSLGGYKEDKSVQTIQASPNPGYIFLAWSGDISGASNPISVVMNINKAVIANFSQDLADNDADGLSNYQEIVTYGINPNQKDTNSDGIEDGQAVALGYSPTFNFSALISHLRSHPPTGLYTASQMQAMAFGDLVLTKNVNGSFTLNYDIEQSTDLQTWTPYQALSLPLTGLPTDKAFVRIKPKQ